MIEGETIATGAATTCEICGTTPQLDVLQSRAGYYVGTRCRCGPYSRESGYYPDQETAAKALSEGSYGR